MDEETRSEKVCSSSVWVLYNLSTIGQDLKIILGSSTVIEC